MIYRANHWIALDLICRFLFRLWFVPFIFVFATGALGKSVCEDRFEIGVVNQSIPSLSASELREKVFAVHVTNSFPFAGVLEINPRRPTVHFSLGEMVRPHGTHSWEKSAYGFVMPLGTIEKYLVNLNPYDSFTLGSLNLPEEAVWIVPEDEITFVPSHVKYVSYDPATESLREVIDQVIQDGGGLKIEMANTSSFTDFALIGNRRVNLLEFFEPILAENPSLSFGNHLFSQKGEAYRIGQIDAGIRELLSYLNKSDQFLAQDSMYKLLPFFTTLIDHNLQRIGEHSYGQVEGFDEIERDVRAFVDLYRTEIYLNGLGLTLAGIESTYLDSLLKKKFKSVAWNTQVTWLRLRGKIPALSDSLKNQTDEFTLEELDLMAHYLSSMAIEEAKGILNQHLREGGTLYTMTHILTLVHQLSKQLNPLQVEDHLVLELNGLLQGLIDSDADLEELTGVIFNNLRNYLESSGPAREKGIDLITRTTIRNLFNRVYKTTIPRGPVGFSELLESLVQTRYFKAEPPSHPLEESVGLILESLGRSDFPSFENGEGFERAIRVSYLRSSYIKAFNDLLRPLNQTPPIGEPERGQMLSLNQVILSGMHGSLDEIFERLGLNESFRRKYPEDTMFWQSPLSLPEIVSQLREM